MTAETEEEQLERIKEWWLRNGKPLLMGGGLALVLALGWQFWQQRQLQEAEAASVLYQQFLNASYMGESEPLAELVKLAGRLKNEHPGSHYSQYAGLFLARAAVESGRLDEAARELRLVVDQPASTVLEELARQRLARVLAAQGKPQQALDLLRPEAPSEFLALRQELQGDLLLQLDRRAEAREAYLKARAAQPSNISSSLQLKLDNLAGVEAVDA